MRKSMVRPVLSPIAHKSVHCGSGDHARLCNGRFSCGRSQCQLSNDLESWQVRADGDGLEAMPAVFVLCGDVLLKSQLIRTRNKKARLICCRPLNSTFGSTGSG